ncbi:dethiobiotin synthetase [Bradyrhizobium sp. NAS80.1]|uniref:dethiobiotin synthase n=1 Tax=Bradyrhizobium sp. NAS80.1 TaxID=1680159 RepID=UPI0009624ED6|nr:dethiobiotin synthase [Bradyrhizobium sp. NAS80.1]OKO72578.1 dethiobiotin synthetase [Bradyrhizobium sp. NAS80.1]
MIQRFVVTGTDTGVGKTVFSAALTGTLNGCYWKPVQSGLQGETDSETVSRLAGIPATRIIPEACRLRAPESPHLSAAIDGVRLDPAMLQPPDTGQPLVIEGAGGLLVPLTRSVVFADIFARWRFPAILCARTALGTINHTLLSLEAMRSRHIPILGVAFIGDAHADTESTIVEIGKVRHLGRLPYLDVLTPELLRRAFRDNFDLSILRGRSPQ